MSVKVGNIQNEFIVHSQNKDAFIEKNDNTLYERIGQKYEGFRGHDLIAGYEFTSDWNTWEVHPTGDESVLLLSGKITFVLRLPDGEESITLYEPGSYIIVPKGIWHTAKISVKSKLLFITPGEGTQNKEEPD
jgi:cupin superfamily acireductone dioxygenase involved in methionine salvage